jgi:hypothetical protein
VTRAQALEAAVALIAHSVPHLSALIDLLKTAGQTRLANAQRAHSPGGSAEVGGMPKPDAALWRTGRLP